MSTGSRKNVEASIYQLKVTLRGLRPPIWRRFLVRDDETLSAIHQHLQLIMGWADAHMHSFRTEWGEFGAKDLADTIGFDDEATVRIREVLRRDGDKLAYDYDPSDGWTHAVVLERIRSVVLGQPYPWVLAGRRACPPEKVGGVCGYEWLVATLDDPYHPAHRDMKRWRAFDPTAFDVQAVNWEIHGHVATLRGRFGEPRNVRRTRSER